MVVLFLLISVLTVHVYGNAFRLAADCTGSKPFSSSGGQTYMTSNAAVTDSDACGLGFYKASTKVTTYTAGDSITLKCDSLTSGHEIAYEVKASGNAIDISSASSGSCSERGYGAAGITFTVPAGSGTLTAKSISGNRSGLSLHSAITLTEASSTTGTTTGSNTNGAGVLTVFLTFMIGVFMAL